MASTSSSVSQLLYFDFTFFTTEKDKISDKKLVLDWCKEACSSMVSNSKILPPVDFISKVGLK